MERSEEAIKFLEAKIAETEEELARLQQALTDVESDLQALRKARDLLVGEDAAPRPPRRAGDPPREEDAPPRPVRRGRELLLGETAPPPKPDDVRRREPAPPTTTNRPAASSSSRQGPLRPLLLDILRDATKPLHVDELVQRLRAAGKHTDAEAVSLSLAEYVKLGKVWRTPQGTYALPKG